MAGDTSSELYELKNDLRMSMIIAAFTGISWFIGAEINTSLFLLFKRRKGLYFWSAALSSWGVVLQPLFIILADFGIWTDLKGSITMIYLTWLIMVVPQSWLLYSRLHLIANHATMLRWIKFILIFTSIIFSVPTIVMGTIAQATSINPSLFRINMTWDRVQLTVFFVQETALSLLYIRQAHLYLRTSSLLSHDLSSRPPTAQPASSTRGSSSATSETQARQVLTHLVVANLLVIALDIALLGVQYAGLFYLQGAFKPCVYGVKLKVEFAILNRLVDMVRARGWIGTGSGYYNNQQLGEGVNTRPQTRGGLGGRGQQQQQNGDGAWKDAGDGREVIGMGSLEGVVRMGPPRSRSQESQTPIWDGRAGPGTAVSVEGGAVVRASGERGQGQGGQWRQVYHR